MNMPQFKKTFLLLALFFYAMYSLHAQQIISLYEGKIPNSKPAPNKEKISYYNNGNSSISNISLPTLSIYLPDKNKATGAAVVICPGGGYVADAYKHEGTDVAKRFADSGIAAFVVKYRLPDDSTMINKEIGPLQDAQRAVQIVREHADEWNIQTGKIGIMGFSAGGHLASTEGTHYQHSFIDNPKHTNLRPDFMVLIYPVISFNDNITHMGSRDNLIGKNPSPEKIKLYSNEMQVTDDTPPTFLVHAKDDDVVPVANSINFENALQQHNVPSQLFLYEKGGHGFGLKNPTSNVDWFDLTIEWMKKMNFLK
jgi:acetyl esterase/lipase